MPCSRLSRSGSSGYTWPLPPEGGLFWAIAKGGGVEGKAGPVFTMILTATLAFLWQFMMTFAAYQ